MEDFFNITLEAAQDKPTPKPTNANRKSCSISREPGTRKKQGYTRTTRISIVDNIRNEGFGLYFTLFPQKINNELFA